MKKILWLIIGGLVYYAIEGFWRIPENGGWANIAMLFVGGLCFVLVGSINQVPAFYGKSMRFQAVFGALLVLIVEFISGCILNLWLGMGIWDYSNMPFNILGQVCLLYGILWILLIPFGIWLEDWLNYTFWFRYGGEKPLYNYTLSEAYAELFEGI